MILLFWRILLMTLGERIKQLRKEKGMTQEELAKTLGVIRGTLSVWEIDKAEPDNKTLGKIADYFDVTIDYLLGRDTEPDNFDNNLRQILSKMSDEEGQQTIKILELIKQMSPEDKKMIMDITKRLVKEMNK